MLSADSKKLGQIIKILTISLLAVSFVSYFSFNYFHLFGHIESFWDFLFCLLQWVKIAGLVVIPAAVFLKSPKFAEPVKYFYVLVPLLSLAFIGRYIGLVKVPVHIDQELYSALVSFMPKALILTLFIVEALLMTAIAVLFWLRDGIKIEKEKLNNLLVFLPVFLAVTPLSLLDNLIRLLPAESGFYQFLLFKNFTVWHFLAFASIFAATYFAYRFLKKKDSAARHRYLCVLSIALLVQYMSKASRLVGDGYNVYYTIIAFIPLFICNIGVPVAAVAVFTKNRVLNNIAFFVHAAGALTVFFYFGKDEMSNYGTAFNYSFLYFAFTHAVLFMICVLPTLLGEHKFRLKGGVVPMIYYFIVILTAATASELVTTITGNLYGPEFAIRPNYAFSQVSPLPVPFTPVILDIFGLKFDVFYLPILFLVYVLIFFTFYAGYLLIIELPKKRAAGKNAAPKEP